VMVYKAMSHVMLRGSFIMRGEGMYGISIEVVIKALCMIALRWYLIEYCK
jgi:hypothetical protein